MEMSAVSETILAQVNYPQDLKSLELDQLEQLIGELRNYLIDVVAKVGGHLAPSLGVVELTVALHYVFDTPTDKIVWDVGHQAYIHKILTGRKQLFPTLRQYKGISGFPKISESEYDAFGVGHSSTSISAALGMACARDHHHENYSVIAVLGDGALTGGLAYEGLNNAGMLKKNLIVVLNDNKMSISPNVGAIAQYLTSMITAPTYNKLRNDIWELTGRMDRLGQKIRVNVIRLEKVLKSVLVPGILFEKMGFRYFGPVDGHNLPLLIKMFKQIKTIKGPVLVHVLTKKGKGYLPAENNASVFHGLGAFDPETGTPFKKSAPPTYTSVFGKTLVQIAKQDERIVGITAAMADGTGLNYLQAELPKRFYDVGIAEQHAVTFACGLALGGMKPVVAIYSTFLQRAFDQLVHDVGIQKIPLVFAIDRAGLVGSDGATHHGVFDLSYVRIIPNFVIMAPKDEAELQDMLWTALHYEIGPILLRFPRGSGVGVPLKTEFRLIPVGQSETIRRGKGIALLGIGSTVHLAQKVADLLDKEQITAQVENMRFVKPLDDQKLLQLAENFHTLITIEDNTVCGGFGSAIREFYGERQIQSVKIVSLGLPDQFIEQGEVNELLRELDLSPTAIAAMIQRNLWETSNGVKPELAFSAAAASPVSGKFMRL